MIKIILGISALIIIAIIFLFIVCACIVSNIYSEREKENETKHK